MGRLGFFLLGPLDNRVNTVRNAARMRFEVSLPRRSEGGVRKSSQHEALTLPRNLINVLKTDYAGRHNPHTESVALNHIVDRVDAASTP